MIKPEYVRILPNTMIDDFFLFGFLAGIIGYAVYLYTNKDDPKNHVSVVSGLYGTFLSGCVGGMLAIVFDNCIEVSIVVGFLNQIIYMALLKAAKNGSFWPVIKEIVIRLLTGGKGA